MIKTWVWIVIIAVIVIASVTLSIVFFLPRSDGETARVYVDGEEVFSVDLSRVDEPFEKEIVTEYGKNVLEIQKGKIRVKSADCDGGDCVQTGWSSGAPIVCLPHKLVIKIEKKDEPDAISK